MLVYLPQVSRLTSCVGRLALVGLTLCLSAHNLLANDNFDNTARLTSFELQTEGSLSQTSADGLLDSEGWSKGDSFGNSSGLNSAATILSNTTVRLEWTAPGDDGNVGRAQAYEIRHSQSPITSNNWNSATIMSSPPTPGTAGAYQSVYINGLAVGETYYFAIKARDDAGNWSAISNVAQKIVIVQEILCGDVNSDDVISMSDIVFLINYMFGGGDAPSPLLVGDANCNGNVSISDAAYLINYVFGGGPAPCCLAS